MACQQTTRHLRGWIAALPPLSRAPDQLYDDVIGPCDMVTFGYQIRVVMFDPAQAVGANVPVGCRNGDPEIGAAFKHHGAGKDSQQHPA